MVHSLIWWWACTTLDTEAEWGTIMKHHVIKMVPDKLSRVWWASVSLWISRAPQLISHQGGAQGARSLKPSITTLEGRQSPAYFHVSSTPTPNLRLSNQGAQMTREVLDGSKGGWRVQSTVRKKDKRNERPRNFWFCKRFFSSHLISLKKSWMDWKHEGSRLNEAQLLSYQQAYKILMIGLANWNASLVIQCAKETEGVRVKKVREGSSHFTLARNYHNEHMLKFLSGEKEKWSDECDL